MALQYQSSLTGPEIDAALEDMAAHNSEAWAVGARDGVEVGATDITYHNNAEYYAESANAAAARAEAAVPSGTAGAVFFDRAQTLTTVQKRQAMANIGATDTPRRNLIDNAWFFVNQRGAASYSTVNAFGIDRWALINGGPVYWSEDGISAGEGHSFIIRQRFEAKRWKSGESLMASILLSDGTIYTTSMQADGSLRYFYNSGTRLPFRMRIQPSGLEVQFQILGDNTGEKVRAIKLERNGRSTLSANDAPPDYASELAKCRYYFQRVTNAGSSRASIAMGCSYSGSGVFFGLISPMRARPTITRTGTWQVQPLGGTGVNVTAQSIGYNAPYYSVSLGASGITAGQVVLLYGGAGATLDFSAEL